MEAKKSREEKMLICLDLVQIIALRFETLKGFSSLRLTMLLEHTGVAAPMLFSESRKHEPRSYRVFKGRSKNKNTLRAKRRKSSGGSASSMGIESRKSHARSRSFPAST